jgi:small subunit ribosomal protein S16
MVKIRLKRIGAKKKPFYRVVVADSRAPRNGRLIEEIGTYDPMADPTKFEVDMDKVREWVRKGAQMTDTVMQLVKKSGGLEKPAVEEETVEKVEAVKAEEEDTASEETEEDTASKETEEEDTASKETEEEQSEPETAEADKKEEDAAEGDSK